MSMQYAYPSLPPNAARLSLSNPAIGAELAIQMGDNNRLLLYSMSFLLVTDATATARFVRVGNGFTGSHMNGGIAPDAQGASSTVTYIFTSGGGASVAPPTIGFKQGTLPIPCILEPNKFINILVENIAAGDQLSNIEIFAGQYVAPLSVS